MLASPVGGGLLICSRLFLTAPVPATADTAVRLRAILTVVEARNQDRGPVMMSYAVHERLPPGAVTRLTGNRGTPPPAQDVLLTAEVRLAYQGTAISVQRGGTFLVNQKPVPLITPMRYLFDGTRTVSVEHGQWKTSTRQSAAVSVKTPWDVAGDRTFLRAARDWRDGAYERETIPVTTSVKDVVGADGQPRTRLEITTPSTDRRMIVTFLPDLKYALETRRPGAGADSYRAVVGRVPR